MLREKENLSLESLSKRLEELGEYVDFIKCCCSKACEVARLRMSEQCKQWSMELESGGNIKFVPGDPSLSWYRTCCDLINSRFSVTNPLAVVSGIISHILCLQLHPLT